MNKGGFKIGDKVKLKYPQKWSIGTQIGEVTGFDKFYIKVMWKDGKLIHNDYPHLSREIEHIVKVGEQLLFNFMT